MLTHILGQWLISLQGSDTTSKILANGQRHKRCARLEQGPFYKTLIQSGKLFSFYTAVDRLAGQSQKELFFRIREQSTHGIAFEVTSTANISGCDRSKAHLIRLR